VGGWSWFIFTGSIQSLWPMFGVANQLLAVVALTVATTVIVNEGRSRYAATTLAPLLFLGTTTLAGGALSIRDIFLPLTRSVRPAEAFKGWLNSGLTAVMMASVLFVLADAVPRWMRHWRTGREETKAALASFSRAA
jgi:carbon starvation protein